MSLDLKKWEVLRNGDRLYHYISEAIHDDELYYVFLDEIQLVDGFEEVVNSIKAELNTDVYITGSNSKFLSHDINTIFRGRGIEIKVFPLSFSEFLAYRQTDKFLIPYRTRQRRNVRFQPSAGSMMGIRKY